MRIFKMFNVSKDFGSSIRKDLTKILDKAILDNSKLYRKAHAPIKMSIDSGSISKQMLDHLAATNISMAQRAIKSMYHREIGDVTNRRKPTVENDHGRAANLGSLFHYLSIFGFEIRIIVYKTNAKASLISAQEKSKDISG